MSEGERSTTLATARPTQEHEMITHTAGFGDLTHEFVLAGEQHRGSA